MTRLTDFPDDHPAYVPQEDGRLMETTVGAIRASKPEPIYHTEEEATLAMWRYIARTGGGSRVVRPWLGSGDDSPEAEWFRNHVRECAAPQLKERLGL